MSKARELAELGAVYDSGALSNRNLIINGDMRIDQRNSGSALTVDGTTKLSVDRFFVEEGSDAILSAQQVSDAPDDFLTLLKITVSTADTSLGATQLDVVGHRIEGQNIQHLNWGSSSAQTVTLSFYVKSSLTGTFGGSFWNNAFDRSHPFTYSISSANTWEYKTVTVEGPTSGTFLTTNGRGVSIAWSLGAGSTYSGTAGSWQSSGLVNATGSVSVVGTASATWQITGVQLELGTEATPFEHRSFGDELLRCKRYFERLLVDQNGSSFALGYGEGTSQIRTPFKYETKRSSPSLAVSAAGNWEFVNGVESKTASAITGSALGKQFGLFFGTVSGATISRVYYVRANAGEYIDLDSEL